jgi:D-beta-D-heptose 7-phosphate kinase/D-beta-D-heptose 1-phosphate adenosyltransferase
MGKIVSVSKIKSLSAKLKSENEQSSSSSKKIVLAGGCFDILHIGHMEFLKNAKAAGDILILLLESDESIKNLKGEKRPINNQKNRAYILSSVEYVDYIIPLEKPFKDEDYQDLISKIKPDIIAITKGDPNQSKKILQAKSVGGKVKVVLKNSPEHSTTKLLDYF